MINKYNQGSYLLKHIADVTAKGEIDSIKRIGKETPDSGNQTNYVVDPNTVNKTGNKESLWYDNYYMDDFGWNEMPAVTKNGEHYILDYTRENTLLKQYQTEKHYITALHLQCVYVPNGYIAGETFYTYKNIRYQNKNTLLAAVIKDQPNANLSNVTEAEGVIVYENGKCYFTYYIRHSEDNNATEDGIMKYGIVRNNIYRVTINSFSGIGSEDKYDPIPITKNVEFTIWVVPWNVIENPEIIL